MVIPVSYKNVPGDVPVAEKVIVLLASSHPATTINKEPTANDKSNVPEAKVDEPTSRTLVALN
jgi:hypothetical protein